MCLCTDYVYICVCVCVCVCVFALIFSVSWSYSVVNEQFLCNFYNIYICSDMNSAQYVCADQQLADSCLEVVIGMYVKGYK